MYNEPFGPVGPFVILSEAKNLSFCRTTWHNDGLFVILSEAKNLSFSRRGT